MNIELKPEEALRIGIQLHKSGDYEDAEMFYRQIISADPDNINALHYLAVLCHQFERNQEAFELIQRIIEIDPGNPDAHNNIGNVLEGLGRFPEAEAYYRRAIELNPNHAPAFNNLGVLFISQNKLDDAIETYNKAITISPKNPDFWYNLGNAYRRKRESDRAIEYYREALKCNQSHEGAWRGLGRSFLILGKRDEAVKAFDEWLRLDPENMTASYLRASCLGQDAPERTPDEFVSNIFDSMATRFDTHLIDNLEYRAPGLLTEALTAALPPANGDLEILDAGCGTGLCGPLLRPYARRLSGVDLSRGMLNVAEGRKVYDRLLKAELTGFIGSSENAYDVIISSDTLCYFGALEPFFEASIRALRPGGFLAFTTEDAGDGGDPWRLDPTTRYSHSRTYLMEALQAAGFAVHSFSSAVLRKESGDPVNGNIVVARRMESSGQG